MEISKIIKESVKIEVDKKYTDELFDRIWYNINEKKQKRVFKSKIFKSMSLVAAAAIFLLSTPIYLKWKNTEQISEGTPQISLNNPFSNLSGNINTLNVPSSVVINGVLYSAVQEFFSQNNISSVIGKSSIGNFIDIYKIKDIPESEAVAVFTGHNYIKIKRDNFDEKDAIKSIFETHIIVEKVKISDYPKETGVIKTYLEMPDKSSKILIELETTSTKIKDFTYIVTIRGRWNKRDLSGDSKDSGISCHEWSFKVNPAEIEQISDNDLKFQGVE